MDRPRAADETAALIGLTAFTLSPSDAHAIITRHDVDDADYIVDGAEYPELVDLFEPGDCLATLGTLPIC